MGLARFTSIAYSIIAIQEMNLCRFYPPILWNTARLLVESDSTENMEYTFTDGGNDEDAEVEKK